jgi:predicted ArsR family transcriptional regulator
MVSLPERHYEFMGRILTEALQTRTEGEAPEDAARRIARNNGLAIGRELAKKANISISGSKRVAAVVRKILSQRGYEPYSDGHGGLRLRNCPFHELSRGAPELICELNHQFVGGLLRGLADRRLKAILDRQPPQCCVHVKSPGR